AELPGVEDRLRSRFTWGLIAEIETPDLETRVAILKRKAELESLNLPDEVALYLAAHIKSNVRELEGALLRLAARASFHGQEISSRFGGTDHATVISAVRKIERLCTEDPTVKSVVGTLEGHLRRP